MSKLALHGGTPVRPTPIESPWPDYGAADGRRLIEVLESRAWGGYPEPSPKTAEFAEAFARYHGAEHGVLCVNGSVSLEMALVALDLEYGDEVIVPSYTWIATGACAVHVNAVPVFVDVDPDTYCMDPAAVEAAITPRTKAVIPVHLGASIADLDRLTEICERHGLALIEDCAHGHGGKWRGRGVGSWGDVGSFSFQVSKLMTCGEGGALITKSEELAARLHWIVNCGRKEPGYDGFKGTRFGINGRVSEFQAALLLGQLERLEAATRKREEAMAYLRPRILEVGGLTPLERDPRVTTQNAYEWIFKYDPEHFCGVHRDVFLKALEAEGVACDGPFYVPMHEHPLMTAESRHWPALRERYGEGFKAPETQAKLNFPVTARAAYEEAVWMHYPYLMGGQEDLDAIVEAIAKVKAHASELL